MAARPSPSVSQAYTRRKTPSRWTRTPGSGQNTLTVGYLAWDFDGTLGYREGPWSSALLSVLEEEGRGVGFDANLLRAGLRTGFPWHAPEISHGELSSPEAWWEALSPVFVGAFEAGGLDPATSRTLAARVREAYTDPRRWRLFEDTLPALRHLSSLGWTHVVLSNHVPELAQILGALGLGDHVGRVFNSAETGYEKPHPGAFENLLGALDLPEKIWMIGDNPEADVRGAEAAGIPAILVRGRPGGARRHRRDLLGVADIVGRG